MWLRPVKAVSGARAVGETPEGDTQRTDRPIPEGRRGESPLTGQGPTRWVVGERTGGDAAMPDTDSTSSMAVEGEVVRGREIQRGVGRMTRTEPG